MRKTKQHRIDELEYKLTSGLAHIQELLNAIPDKSGFDTNLKARKMRVILVGIQRKLQ